MRARRRRRRRLVAVMVLIVTGALVAFDLSRADRTTWVSANAEANPPARPDAATVAAVPSPDLGVPTPVPAVPRRGQGTFTFAGGHGGILGVSGRLQRYQVAVEDGIDIPPDTFAAAVDAILGDPRSWIASGTVRLQRVPAGAATDFAIYLATPSTSELMCRADLMETEQYTSCRLSTGKVVINLARWLTAVPDYGAPLEVYRAYAVNHEVGHQLRQWHETCPGPGLAAPVMQQQTLGLQGCVANAWPYLDGEHYRGPPASQ
jgi:hypothetical protein